MIVTFSAPSGCLQYHTGIDGRFETFNFPGGSPVEMHLPNQDYQICVRQEEGNVEYFCECEFMISLNLYDI